jgi:hypothetical protein
MKRAWCWALGVWAVAACKTDAVRRGEVAACSERSRDALEIELCLSSNYGWKEGDARRAAVMRARYLDSLHALVADSLWAVQAARRRSEISECGEADMARCLLVRFGWPERRAAAASDSVWRANTPRHRTEIQACSNQRQSSVGSCLILRYKWPNQRALALDDSIQRARMR